MVPGNVRREKNLCRHQLLGHAADADGAAKDPGANELLQQEP
jgi:hypothetical protein